MRGVFVDANGSLADIFERQNKPNDPPVRINRNADITADQVPALLDGADLTGAMAFSLNAPGASFRNASMAGIKLTHIPYKGSAPALTDLVGGHVAIYFSSLPPALGLVREGKVRALAVTGAKRSPIFPELPTVAEAGLPKVKP